MDQDERTHLFDVQQTTLRRLQHLERQAATYGIDTPPQVGIEIENLQKELASISAKLNTAGTTIDRQTLRDLRGQALRAYHRKQWAQAVELLEQIVKADFTDADSRTKLTEAERWLRLEDDYTAICELRDEGEVEAVRSALEDLERQWPGFPDNQRLQQWVIENTRLMGITLNGKYGYIDMNANVIITIVASF